MALESLKEITDWNVEYRQPNHTYLFDGERAVAYRKWHTGKVEWFKTPIRIDKRRRKFQPESIKRFGKIKYKPETEIQESQTLVRGNAVDEVEVQGSKGTYIVNKRWRTCSCPGFTFRRKCRHIEEFANGQESLG